MDPIEKMRREEYGRHRLTMDTIELVERTAICGFVGNCDGNNIFLDRMDTMEEVIRVLNRLGRYKIKHYYLSPARQLAINYAIEGIDVCVIAYVPIEYLGSVGPNCRIVEKTEKQIVCEMEAQ